MSLSDISKWARFKCVGYLRGRGLVYGAQQEIYPQQATAPGKFALYADVATHPRIDVCDGDLSVLADNAFDYLFVGRRLQEVTDPETTLRQAVAKLKPNSHLILLFETTETWSLEAVQKLVSRAGAWILKDTYAQYGYVLQVYKKVAGTKGITQRVVTPDKTACIARYGAMGDMIMLTPLIKQLHDDGYLVTLNLTGYSAEIIKHNPYVHNIILQERDAIPNSDLGGYWKEWQSKYDRYINLSESIEGTLLKVEGRRDYFTTNAWRHEKCNRNYYDFTMRLGGYPSSVGRRGELYFSNAEERSARKFRDRYKDNFLILWALNGSSHHKKYELFQPVMAEFLDGHPNVRLCTVGDEAAKSGQLDHPHAIAGAGEWGIRHSLALTSVADLVIGPESVIINAAGCFDTPKIPLLSHSSHENLCKHFVNDYCLAPNVTLAPCYGQSGCHQLHYTKESCPQVEMLDENNTVLSSGPACAMGAIEADRLVARIEEVMKNHPRKILCPNG